VVDEVICVVHGSVGDRQADEIRKDGVRMMAGAVRPMVHQTESMQAKLVE
jgi:hypothetical protein